MTTFTEMLKERLRRSKYRSPVATSKPLPEQPQAQELSSYVPDTEQLTEYVSLQPDSDLMNTSNSIAELEAMLMTDLQARNEQEVMPDAFNAQTQQGFAAMKQNPTEIAQEQAKGMKEDIIRTAMGEEGGFNDIAEDTGGATKYGIALNHNKKELKELGVPATPEGVKGLTEEQAMEIYDKKYFQGYHVDKLPPHLQHAYFTSLINSPRKAIKAVQALVGLKGKDVDGYWGKQTEKAIASFDFSNTKASSLKQAYARNVFENASDAKLKKFANGWLNRYLETDQFGSRGIDARKMTRARQLDLISNWKYNT